MFLEPHFGRENQIVLLVLLNSSRSHVGSHIFGESARPKVKKDGVWGFKVVYGSTKSV